MIDWNVFWLIVPALEMSLNHHQSLSSSNLIRDIMALGIEITIFLSEKDAKTNVVVILNIQEKC